MRKCTVSRVFDSLHICMRTSDTQVTARLMCACKRALIRLSDVFTKLGSESSDRCVRENVQSAQCLTHCTFTCIRQTLGSLHVYMHLMCACKHALIRLSDACVHVIG